MNLGYRNITLWLDIYVGSFASIVIVLEQKYVIIPCPDLQ